MPRNSRPPAVVTARFSRYATVSRTGALLRIRCGAAWPATSPKADRFRAYVDGMYWHAFSLLATGRPLADLYFQHCLRLLADAWTGAGAEDGLIDRIRHAVQGDPGAADAA